MEETYSEEINGSPRSIKRRKLEHLDHASSPRASSPSAVGQGSVTPPKRSRRTKAITRHDSTTDGWHEADTRDDGPIYSPAPHTSHRTLDGRIAEGLAPDGLNGDAVTVTPAKRRRGRPRKTAPPSTDVRLSDLIEGGEEKDFGGDDIIASPASTRRSGRQPRKSKKLLDQLEAVRDESRAQGTPTKRKIGQPPSVHNSPGHDQIIDDLAGSIPLPPDNDAIVQQELQSLDVADIVPEEALPEQIDQDVRPKKKRGRPRKGANEDGRQSIQAEDHPERLTEGTAERADVTHESVFPGLGRLLQKVVQDSGCEAAARSMKRIILEKLTGKRKLRLVGHDEEYRKVHQIIKQTVVAGEGNSLLVIGARGTGKTTVSLIMSW